MTNVRRKQRKQRGWIMLIVMLLLLALALSVTAYYTQSEDYLFAGQSISAYNVASLRAQFGAEQALALIRSGQIKVTTLTTPCSLTAPLNDPWVDCAGISASIPTVDNGNTLGLQQGGGLQYDYIVYHPAGTSVPANLYTIRSHGYYGYNAASNNFYVSEVEINVQTGSGGSGKCTSYDCS